MLSVATAVTPAMLASSTSAGAAQIQPEVQRQVEQVPATEPAALTIVEAVPAAEAPAAALPPQAAASDDGAPDARHVECVAKIIMHEAAYEPRSGRIAVAQVVRARIRDGRFARDACAVARQRGQFFNVDAFRPSRSTPEWADAVAIAAETLRGQTEDVVPGALFFHAAYAPMSGRKRVGRIGGHVFYR